MGGEGLNLLEQAIGMLSPKNAYKREAWRQGLDTLRGYDAGGGGRLNSGWRVTNQSAELTDRQSRDVIRARARDLERNSDIATSIIHAYRRNLIGKGYTLQAKTGNPDLDNTIEAAWKTWCKAKHCDVTGTQSLQQILGMAVTRKKVDGGVLFLKRYTDCGRIPLQLQMVEVDELDITQSVPRAAGNKVVGGIEYNAYHKPVGYFLRQYDLEGWQIQDPVYLEAEDVIFYFAKSRPSQLREISDMAPTVTRVRDANEFMTAVSVAERLAACVALVIQQATPGDGIGRLGAPAGQVDYEGKKLTPGMIMKTNPGDKVEVVDPKGTGTDATAYLKLQQGLISAGQGLSYESVSRDMSQTNYSSARQGAIEDEGTFAAEAELLEGVMSEIYESFVLSGYLAGVLDLPGFWEKKELYLAHNWVKAPKKWIDPAKESTANKIAMMTGQKTFKDVAAEQGKDWKEAIDDMAEVIRYGQEAGIEMGGIVYGSNAGKKPTGGKPQLPEHDGRGDSDDGGTGKQPPPTG